MSIAYTLLVIAVFWLMGFFVGIQYEHNRMRSSPHWVGHKPGEYPE